MFVFWYACMFISAALGPNMHAKMWRGRLGWSVHCRQPVSSHVAICDGLIWLYWLFGSDYDLFGLFCNRSNVWCSDICLHVDFCGTWILRLWLWCNIFAVVCWVLLALAQGKKCLGSFLIMFASYYATHLLFGVLICLHVDFCGTWILGYDLIFVAACWFLWHLVPLALGMI